MKTFKELFEEIVQSNELKKAYEDAVKSHTVETFLKEHGCDASIEDIKNFFDEQIRGKELTDAEMSAVAGGSFGDLGGADSSVFPWVCNPKYSRIIGEDGKINGGLICA